MKILNDKIVNNIVITDHLIIPKQIDSDSIYDRGKIAIVNDSFFIHDEMTWVPITTTEVCDCSFEVDDSLSLLYFTYCSSEPELSLAIEPLGDGSLSLQPTLGPDYKNGVNFIKIGANNLQSIEQSIDYFFFNQYNNLEFLTGDYQNLEYIVVNNCSFPGPIRNASHTVVLNTSITGTYRDRTMILNSSFVVLLENFMDPIRSFVNDSRSILHLNNQNSSDLSGSNIVSLLNSRSIRVNNKNGVFINTITDSGSSYELQDNENIVCLNMQSQESIVITNSRNISLFNIETDNSIRLLDETNTIVSNMYNRNANILLSANTNMILKNHYLSERTFNTSYRVNADCIEINYYNYNIRRSIERNTNYIQINSSGYANELESEEKLEQNNQDSIILNSNAEFRSNLEQTILINGYENILSNITNSVLYNVNFSTLSEVTNSIISCTTSTLRSITNSVLLSLGIDYDPASTSITEMRNIENSTILYSYRTDIPGVPVYLENVNRFTGTVNQNIDMSFTNYNTCYFSKTCRSTFDYCTLLNLFDPSIVKETTRPMSALLSPITIENGVRRGIQKLSLSSLIINYTITKDTNFLMINAENMSNTTNRLQLPSDPDEGHFIKLMIYNLNEQFELLLDGNSNFILLNEGPIQNSRVSQIRLVNSSYEIVFTNGSWFILF